MELSDSSVSAGPAVGGERIISLDVLRGFALLGILLMNILAMGMPWWVYSNPAVVHDLLPVELFTYRLTDMFVEGTLRTVFSMLFGAGIVLFTARLAARHMPVAGLYYRRTLLLILFGLINGYIFIWWGDILFGYGLAGLLLYFARNLKPRTLIILAVFMLTLLGAARFGQYYSVQLGMTEMPAIEAALEAGKELNEKQQALYEQYLMLELFHSPGQEKIDQAIAVFDGSLMDLARWNGEIYSMFTLNPQFLIFIQLDVIMMMLFGMALYKWGVLSGQRSKAFYWRALGLGYGIGLMVNYYESGIYIDSGFSIIGQVEAGRTYDLGRISVALGHISMIMLICKYEAFSKLRTVLTVVGRMALTNYLMQSILAIIIFWGFGLYNDLLRHELYLVVVAIWAFQIVFSMVWLGRYRFGPAEWLWRSLTYGKRQPMRR